jgi:hypothetical protein
LTYSGEDNGGPGGIAELTVPFELRSTALRGVAQSGSAFGWGPKGRWFKSSRPDLLSNL